MFYKFLKYEHYEGLARNGSVRLGTLSDYRTIESGGMVVDGMEGKIRFGCEDATPTREQVNAQPNLSIRVEEGCLPPRVTMRNCTVQGPDCWVFSVADSYSRKTHKQWFEEEGYDCCYQISDPQPFFRLITNELLKHYKAEYKGIGKVHYYNEQAGINPFENAGSYPPVLVKDKAHFSIQDEHRAVWTSNQITDLNPLILNCHGLSRFVSKPVLFEG